MVIWPWQSLFKILNKRKEDLDKNPDNIIRFTSVDDFMDKIKQSKPSIFKRIIWMVNDITWKVYRYFKPAHPQIRKSIPKEFVDISSLIVTVNFEFIKTFHDNEMDLIDWEHNEDYKQFKNWIDSAYNYIMFERPELEKELSNSYPPPKMKGTYEEKYKDVIRFEKLIETKDTEILLQLIKRREMFWS